MNQLTFSVLLLLFIVVVLSAIISCVKSITRAWKNRLCCGIFICDVFVIIFAIKLGNILLVILTAINLILVVVSIFINNVPKDR